MTFLCSKGGDSSCGHTAAGAGSTHRRRDAVLCSHSNSQSSGVSSRTRAWKASRVQNSGEPGRCWPAFAHSGSSRLRFSYRMRMSARWAVSAERTRTESRTVLRWRGGGRGGQAYRLQPRPRAAEDRPVAEQFDRYRRRERRPTARHEPATPKHPTRRAHRSSKTSSVWQRPASAVSCVEWTSSRGCFVRPSALSCILRCRSSSRRPMPSRRNSSFLSARRSGGGLRIGCDAESSAQHSYEHPENHSAQTAFSCAAASAHETA